MYYPTCSVDYKSKHEMGIGQKKLQNNECE